MSKAIPNYLGIFEQKLNLMLKELKKELNKPKKERSKNKLKFLIRDIKKSKQLLKEAKQENAVVCPHCGQEI